MIRLVSNVVFLFLFLLFSIPILGIEWVVKKISKRAADISNLRIAQWVFRRVLSLAGTKITVLGEENLAVAEKEAVLFVPNHRSYFDAFTTYSLVPEVTGYIVQNGLDKIPVANLWLKRIYCLPLDREDVREGLKTILQGVEQLKSGISMTVFPEGTRNRVSDGMLPFKDGALRLAEKSGCPIIPVAISGSDHIMERHMPRIMPAHVVIEYGEPIRMEGLTKEEKKKLGGRVSSSIQSMLEKNESLWKELNPGS